MEQLLVDSPLGPLTLTGGGGALTGLRFGDARGEDAAASPLLERAAGELAAYFAGTLRVFTVPLDPGGTAFQRRVWAEVRKIPYGTTAAYGQIAARIGKPGAAMAVGQANGRNPIPILIPCHRVVGRDGALVGYTGGLEIKRALLALESGGPEREAAHGGNF